MEALSIRQPWAWAIAAGHKNVENRTWNMRYRGPLLIHAGATMPSVADLKAFMVFVGDMEKGSEIIAELEALEGVHFGGVIAKATVVDCVDSSDSPWFAGDYGILLRDVVRLPFHPCKGRLGLFEVPTEQLIEDYEGDRS